MSEIYLDTTLVKTQVIEYDRFKIKNFNLRLHEKVEILILLYPINPEHVVECRTIAMEGQDYEAWAEDDNYVIEFIKRKLLE
jgi:hypothetical protein